MSSYLNKLVSDFSFSNKIRIFCFHHAGGCASFFNEWSDSFSDKYLIVPVQLPGREGRFSEALIHSLESLVDLLWQEIRPHLQQPYIFFGHSMGARIAYELAKRSASVGVSEPECLIVSGTRAPQFLIDKVEHSLPDDELILSLGKRGGTADEILAHSELMNLLLPVIRADYELIEKAPMDRKRRTLSCPILAYGGLSDEGVKVGHLEGWKEKTSGMFKIKRFTGGHFYLNASKNELHLDMQKNLEDMLELSVV